MRHYTAEELGLAPADIDPEADPLRGLPLHCYYDPTVFRFELEAIFDRRWQYFCPTERVAKPGDVAAGTVGRTPVIVTRDEDGELHGLVNICRHRAYRVVDGDRKSCKLLRCFYHSWTYALNGDLVAAPHTSKEESFDKSGRGLRRVSVGVWGHAIFVNPDPNARALHEAHPEIKAWTKSKGFHTEPGRYKLYREVVTEQRSNWKLWYDNGTECYHCPTVHGQTFADAFVTTDDNYVYDLSGQLTSHAFPTAKEVPPDELRSSTYRSFQLFPGCQMIQQDDLMIQARMVPLSADRVRFTAHYLIEDGADPARVEEWFKLWDRTYAEDAGVTEIQQANIESGQARPFRYVGNREGVTVYVNKLIRQAYREALNAAPTVVAAE